MENEILENFIEEQIDEEIIETFHEEVFEDLGKYVVATGKFNCQSFPLYTYKDTIIVNEEGIEEIIKERIALPHLIYVTNEDLEKIDPKNGTKCFDLEHDCVIDYDNTEYVKQETINEFRSKRQTECFSIINRGQFWYNNLTDKQREELKIWYTAWLDVTKTLVEPTKPEWLK